MLGPISHSESFNLPQDNGYHLSVPRERVIFFRGGGSNLVNEINASFDELESLTLQWIDFYLIMDFRKRVKVSPLVRKQIGIRLKQIKPKIKHAALVIPSSPYYKIACTFLSLTSRLHKYSMHDELIQAQTLILDQIYQESRQSE